MDLYADDPNDTSKFFDESFYFEKVATEEYTYGKKVGETQEMCICTPNDENPRCVPPEKICQVNIILDGGIDKNGRILWEMETVPCK